MGSYSQVGSYMYRGKDGSNSAVDPDGGVAFRAYNSTSDPGGAYIGGTNIVPMSTIVGTITYITDDTTWQPINGATVQ